MEQVAVGLHHHQGAGRRPDKRAWRRPVGPAMALPVAHRVACPVALRVAPRGWQAVVEEVPMAVVMTRVRAVEATRSPAAQEDIPAPAEVIRAPAEVIQEREEPPGILELAVAVRLEWATSRASIR